MNLTFGDKIKLSEHFDIPPDKTRWKDFKYKGKTPWRSRAKFKSITGAMKPKSDEIGKLYKNAKGVYILIFRFPRPAFYVGIASGESILKRIRKHRVKVTGSHVGSRPDVDGGVNHTQEWRSFAVGRAIYFLRKRKKKFDTCADAVLLIGTLSDKKTCCEQSALKYFENALVNNKNRMTEKIVKSVMPECKFKTIRKLNEPLCWALKGNKNIVWKKKRHPC